ncbi:8803_t:CDS:2 [Funneliformis caledonium]|uniref:8803_t:CDS:1 n=1 Tax=Funneliformis caledonium TaxID=1117310 RepID=A0A9N8VNC6_9GLOM|nr:8803_t:CDS:2 [Funneliformis caledonium]
MEGICSLPSIDHMTGSKSIVTSPINRQHMPSPGHETMSESKGVLPPLSVLLRPTPQHGLSEVHREISDSVNRSPMTSHHKTLDNLERTSSPLCPPDHGSHVSGQLNYSDHRLPQDGVTHSSQRAIAPDMRLPSIKHFENISSDVQQSSSSVKQHQQVYSPCPPPSSQTGNMNLHSQQSAFYNTSKQQPMVSRSSENGIRASHQHGSLQQHSNNTFSHSNLPSRSPHIAQNSTMWTRPQAISHSPRSSQSSTSSSTSSPQKTIYQNIEMKPIQPIQLPVRFVSNNYAPDYLQNNGTYVKDNGEQSASGTQNMDKTLAEMQKITEYCTIISHFATQYSEYRNQMSKFGPYPPNASHWGSNPTGTPIASVVNLEQQVPEMINRAYQILGILNGVKSEIGHTISNDQDTINLIRTKRTTVGPSATRTKYRKRSKRAAPPGRCHSCNISETPEWRRGPDGARTLCNACGLHFAKLTRKRALSTMQQHHQASVHKMTRNAPVLPSTTILQQQTIITQPKPTMGILGGIHLASPHPSAQIMQNPSKRMGPDSPINHQINGSLNGNYLNT